MNDGSSKTAEVFKEAEESQSKAGMNTSDEAKRTAAITLSLYDNNQFQIHDQTTIDGETFEWRNNIPALSVFLAHLNTFVTRITLGNAITDIFSVEQQKVDETKSK